jgi:hypothetical protein
LKKKWALTGILPFLFLLLTNFFSHFVLFQQMGLYEDDFNFIAKAINWNRTQFLSYLSETLIRNWPQGRPLGFTIPQTVAYLVPDEQALHLLYLGGVLLLTINAFLFYKIVLCWSGKERLALLAAIAFSLFPADTTKSLLIHIYQIQTSVLFCLVGIYFFLRFPRLRFISYVCAFLCLITYETPFSLFFLLPMFTAQRKQKKFWFRHFLICGFVLIITIGIRLYFGENRVSSMGNWPTTLAQIIAGMVIGPVVSMGLFLYGPARTVLHMNRELYGVMGIAFVVFGVFFLCLSKEIKKKSVFESGRTITWRLNAIQILLPEWIADWVKQILMALLWLMTAYIFAFSHFPPVVRYGRGTSVHICATIPAALLFALIISGFWAWIKTKKSIRPLFFFLLIGYLAVTVGNRFSIQQDFVKSWAYQKQFWQEIVELTPDVKDGTIIFVVNHNLPEEHYIESNSWADYFIYGQLFEFPGDWKREPMVLVTDGNWERDLTMVDGKLSFPWSVYWNFPLESNNVILLMDDAQGKLVRVQNDITTLSGYLLQPIPWNDQSGQLSAYPKKSLYHILIE